jgi:hypothetical protein
MSTTPQDFPEYDPVQEQFANLPTAEPEPQFDEIGWRAKGKDLASRETNTKWDLGAWLVEGADALEERIEIEKKFGGKTVPSFYVVASEAIGLAPGTLRDIASTYNRAVSVRTDACTWSHHRFLVNALKEALPKADEKTGNEWLKKWLARAAEDKMPVAALKDAVTAEIRMRKTGHIQVEKSFLVTIPLGVWETLKDIADEESTTVHEYGAELLSGFAASEEGMLKRDVAKKTVKERKHKRRQRTAFRVNNLRLEH